MASNIQKYKTELEALLLLGEKIKLDIQLRNQARHKELEGDDKDAYASVKSSFERDYQRWYTEACSVIKQLLPDRLAEVEQLYMGQGRRKTIDSTTFTIQDWMNGIRAGANAYGKKYFDDMAIVSTRVRTQVAILKSAESRFDSALFDIRQLVQADLFDSELDSARELAGRGFLRAAGAVAGVVLERHLGQVADNHNIKTRKRNPTINDFNELLKEGNVLDVPSWRQIQRLGDIRNICTHDKQREPSGEEVEELISGAEKYTKTLF